jgi:hypothetical protein
MGGLAMEKFPKSTDIIAEGEGIRVALRESSGKFPVQHLRSRIFLCKNTWF